MNSSDEGFQDWTRILFDSGDAKKINNLAEWLIKQFPGTSSANARIWAEALVQARHTTSESFHWGKSDIENLMAFAAAFETAKQAALSLSPMARNALHTSLFLESEESDTADALRTLGEVHRHADRAVQRTLATIGSAHAEYQTNWKAVGVVDAARRCWETLGVKLAPPKTIKDNSTFADFLRGIFDEVGVGASPRSAFDAWYRTMGT